MVEFSLCMPAGPKSEKYIKKAIDSILDQDFEDWELIVVANGKNQENTVAIVKKYKDKRIRLTRVEEGNACTARNEGAKLSGGKYISFFSSDFYMYPGCLRKWKKEFEARPKVDFIYSGYKLMDEGKMLDLYCHTRPFDAWELQIENYIDGGFPMRREVWEKCKWDPEVKSLNDWDFWLTAIDNGFKGEMIPDTTYAAEIPHPDGLSYDSRDNWIERVEFIKKKHKIPIRDICVVSLGAAPHGKNLAKILNADFKYAPQAKPHKYKVIFLVGFFVGNGDGAVSHSQVFGASGTNATKIIYWIGTDILQLGTAASKVCYIDMKQLVDVIDSCVNLTEFDQTHGEMAFIGIKSEIVPFPINKTFKPTPLPSKFSVAIYTPAAQDADWKYNLKMMRDVIKACPDIHFTLFGGGMKDFKAKNVENLGWCDMEEVIAKASCILRVTPHDGMPVAPIEFRLAGRDAITSVQLPYIYFAGTGDINDNNYSKKKEGIVKMLRVVKEDQKKQGGVKEKKKAIEYYKKLTDPEAFKNRIHQLIKEASKKGKAF